jgi:exonuclease III
MKLCGLNCRGLRNRRAVRALLDLQKHMKPDVFFLSETHLDKARAGNLMRKLGYDSLSIHESDGQSGGLLMLWCKETKIKVMSVTKNYICTILKGNCLDFSQLFGYVSILVMVLFWCVRLVLYKIFGGRIEFIC